MFEHWTNGPTPRLRPEQLAELAAIVEAGPDRKIDRAVRWRRVDLKRVIGVRFGVDDPPRCAEPVLRSAAEGYQFPSLQKGGRDINNPAPRRWVSYLIAPDFL